MTPPLNLPRKGRLFEMFFKALPSGEGWVGLRRTDRVAASKYN